MKLHLPHKLSIALILSLGMLAVSVVSAQAATFSLSPASGSTVSGTFDITLSLTGLSTGDQVSAIDAYLNYEPSKLEAQSISVSSGIFNDYPVKTISSTSGQIAISASASAFEPVTSGGTIAVITFKALAASGSTTLSFDYTAGSTTDSNIVDSDTGEELLTQPPTVTYYFGAGNGDDGDDTTPPVTPPAGNGDDTTPKGGEAPEGGVTEPTVLISFLSMAMVGTGLALKARKRITPTFEEKILNSL